MITVFGWIIMLIYLVLQVLVVKYAYETVDGNMTVGVVAFSACLNFMLLWYASILFMVIGMFDLGIRLYSSDRTPDPQETRSEAWLDFGIGTILWVLMFTLGRVT